MHRHNIGSIIKDKNTQGFDKHSINSYEHLIVIFLQYTALIDMQINYKEKSQMKDLSRIIKMLPSFFSELIADSKLETNVLQK